MRLTGERSACGMVRVGDDLVVAIARAAASPARAGTVSLRWSIERRGGFFAEDAARSGAAPAPIADAAPLPAHRTLVLPTDSLLRREVDAGARSAEEFKRETTGALSAHLPIAAEEEALWDVAPLAGGRRIALCATRAESVEGVVRRLDEAGIGATRIVPSALAWALGRLGVDGAGAEPASLVLERTPTGWAAHRYDGLEWAGSRSGAGDPPASIEREAEASGAMRCDWRAEGAAPEAIGAARVALGGALLELWPGVDTEAHPAPEFDLLGARSRRRAAVPPFWRWTAVAALAMIGLIALASSMKHRAVADVARQRTLAKAGEADVKRVESVRKANEAALAAHDRLRRLEAGYVPRWWSLGALSAALPASSWAEGVEIGDGWVYADIVTSASAEALQRLEEHAGFEGVRQSGAAVATDSSGETRVRIEAKVNAPEAPPAPASPAPTRAAAATSRRASR